MTVSNDTPTQTIGTVVSRQNVIQAVIATLQAWISTYLTALETQNDLEAGTVPRPPSDQSYHGGVDFLSFEEQNLPGLIVDAQPVGETADRRGSGDYPQVFEVRVAAITVGGDEATAQSRADWYGAAVMAAIVQHGDLGGLASDTILSEYPVTEFIDPKLRLAAQAVTAFHVAVDSVVNDTAGPLPAEPVGPFPIATSTNLIFEAVPVADTDLDGT